MKYYRLRIKSIEEIEELFSNLEIRGVGVQRLVREKYCVSLQGWMMNKDISADIHQYYTNSEVETINYRGSIFHPDLLVKEELNSENGIVVIENGMTAI